MNISNISGFRIRARKIDRSSDPDGCLPVPCLFHFPCFPHGRDREDQDMCTGDEMCAPFPGISAGPGRAFLMMSENGFRSE